MSFRPEGCFSMISATIAGKHDRLRLRLRLGLRSRLLSRVAHVFGWPAPFRAASSSLSQGNNGLMTRLVLLIGVFILCACSRTEKFVEQRFCMNTPVQVQVLADSRRARDVRTAIDRAFDAIGLVEKKTSQFVPTSDPARIGKAKAGEVVKVSKWTFDCLTIARDVARCTDGRYDVTAGPVIALWGFGTGKTNRVPSQAEIDAALRSIGTDKLTLLPTVQAVSVTVAGVQIDLSSVAKGMAVDAGAEALFQCGFSNFLVNAGGEIRTSSTGEKAWRVGIQAPEEDARADAFLEDRVLRVRNAAVATAGSYRSFFKKGTNTYTHIINPKTGRPIDSTTLSVTVIARTCALADAWATGLFTLPAEEAIELANATSSIECLIIERPLPSSADLRYCYSANFPR